MSSSTHLFFKIVLYASDLRIPKPSEYNYWANSKLTQLFTHVPVQQRNRLYYDDKKKDKWSNGGKDKIPVSEWWIFPFHTYDLSPMAW